nr:Chain C, Marker peptide [Homo sapiens]5C08_H Chain H, Marker peptide [Homo sapiens]5C0F_C Chain C, Marker peptide [Homo sapiens]
RQWGPDPAAV